MTTPTPSASTRLASPALATHAPSKLGKGGRRFAELSDEPLAGAGEDLGRAPVGAATTAKGGFRAAAPGKAPAAAIATRQPAQATRVEKDETSLGHATKSLAEERSGSVGAGAGSSARWAEPPPPAPPGARAARGRRRPSLPQHLLLLSRRPPRRRDLRRRLTIRSDEGAPQEQFARPSGPRPRRRVPPASPAAQTEAPADKKKVSENKDSISLEERVRKAEKLFAEKKWAEAAAAFRALIAQAPSNPAARKPGGNAWPRQREHKRAAPQKPRRQSRTTPSTGCNPRRTGTRIPTIITHCLCRGTLVPGVGGCHTGGMRTTRPSRAGRRRQAGISQGEPPGWPGGRPVPGRMAFLPAIQSRPGSHSSRGAGAARG